MKTRSLKQLLNRLGQGRLPSAKQVQRDNMSLLRELGEILMQHAGQRGDNEGAVDTLLRIINERDRALTLLALDRLKRLT